MAFHNYCYQHVAEHEEAMKEKERQKEERKRVRKVQSAEMVLWEQEDQKWRERNKRKTHAWKASLEEWEASCTVSKVQGRWLKDWDQENPKPKA